jgi:hypothetical protein
MVGSIADLMVQITGNATGLKAALGEAETSTSGFASKLGGVGNIAAAGLGAAAVAIGAFAVKSQETIGGAYAQIAKATGAQGEQLKGLQSVWASVYANVPASASTVTGVLDKVSNTLHIQGDELKTVTQTIVDYGIATGTDAVSDTATFTKGIESANAALNAQHQPLMTAAQLTDMATVAYQKTGVTMDAYSMAFDKGTAAMTKMGLSIPQQIAMLSQLTAAGIPARQLTSIFTGISSAAEKAGVSSSAFWSHMVEDAKKGTYTADELSLLGKNVDNFTAAAKSGKLSNDDLAKSLASSAGASAKAAEANETFGEKLSKFQLKLEEAFAPLGKTILTLLGNFLTMITPLIGIISTLASGFASLPMPVQMVGMALVALVGGLGAVNLVLGKFGLSIKSLPKDIEALVPKIKDLASSMSNVPSKVMGLGSKIGIGGGGGAAGEAAAVESGIGGATTETGLLAGVLATITPLLLPIVAAVAAIGAGFAVLYATSSTFRGMVGGILNTIKDVVGWVQKLVGALMSGNF